MRLSEDVCKKAPVEIATRQPVIPSISVPKEQSSSHPTDAGTLVPSQRATTSPQTSACRDVAHGGSSRRRWLKTTLPTQAWHPLHCAVQKPLLSDSQLSCKESSILCWNLTFSSWKQIFLIVGRENDIKICWKIWVGTRRKNVSCSCRCLSCHP